MKRKITNILLIILLIIIMISLYSSDKIPLSSSELKNDENVKVPGFEATFTILPILAAVCFFLRRREKEKKNEKKNEKRGYR